MTAQPKPPSSFLNIRFLGAAAALALITTFRCGASDFVHPGILVDRQSIIDTQTLLKRNDPVRTQAIEVMKNSPLAKLTYKSQPHAQVLCGPYSRPDIGCSDEVRDAQAAYTHALLGAYLNDSRHFMVAAGIMDSWSETLTGRHLGTNRSLQASWAAELWTRSAEILRYTSRAWPEDRAKLFGEWLLEQYLGDIDAMPECVNGNWYASGIEARMNIGVYTNRRDIYDSAVMDWKSQFPAYVYMKSDGAKPKPQPNCSKPSPSNWFNQKQMASGLAQETCRDLPHTAFGLAAFVNAAETNRIQGGTLYQDYADRLQQAMEFQTSMALAPTLPKWLCSGQLKGSLAGTLEIGYAQLHGRMKRPMTNTGKWLSLNRPSRGQLHFIWETATHGIEITGAADASPP